ncbi:DUF3410 domain-containing protein [Pseudomaricurvus sp. HS19]|nr:DUF3410 domain-containing protein [Pseudomaricurvus sp. HS19]
MRIVADENIPFVEQVFGSLGQVTTLPGRTMTAAQVAEADVLLVRSVTAVNKALLQGSRVKFVGTCTIGTDHLDIAWLQQQGITAASAPGCNANSVVQYALAVMALLRPGWRQMTVGIVGCGNVGDRLRQKLLALGVQVHCYDPWLTPQQVPQLTSLEVVLGCDIVCLHAPLVHTQPHPSWHLLDLPRLQQLGQGTLLMNAGRGAVIDNQALKTVLASRRDLTVALDVWEPEPLLDLELLQQVALATPHIAGYSYDGKVGGTVQIAAALCEHLGLEPVADLKTLLSADASSHQSLAWSGHEGGAGVDAWLNDAILATYDLVGDDSRCRQALLQADGELARARAFDELRKHYPKRREFDSFRLGALPDGLSATEKKSLNQWLATLGMSRQE